MAILPLPYFGVLLMQKLVSAWTKNPTLSNAIKIRSHANKQPMAILMLDAAGIVQAGDAIISIKGQVT
jgi:hypothetical protein